MGAEGDGLKMRLFCAPKKPHRKGSKVERTTAAIWLKIVALDLHATTQPRQETAF